MRLQFPGTGEQASANAERWAQEMIKPAVAVVLDTETTALSGVVIEVAVIDAANGSILLDTLVNPGDEPVDPLAASMHGISPTELAGAPAWTDVLPQLLEATHDRRILAWKAEFDAGTIIRTCERFDADPLHLAAPYRWGCVMECDRVWRKMRRPRGLSGDHGALSDCREIRHQLFYIANKGI